jgi:uncharacterized protein
MLGDMFVFDNVIHVYDLSDENLRRDQPGEAFHARTSRDSILRSVSRLRSPSEPRNRDPNFDWARKWGVEEMYDLVFKGSSTDMAMAQTVPMFDWFEDWYAPVRAQYAMAAAYPDRVLFCGGVDPNFRGLAEALAQVDYQVRELGATSFKFYNGHLETKNCWRCDDEKLAYPIYERIRAAGIKVIQFHKGNPFGLQSLEWLSPLDLQQAARDFPDMTFVVHHLALPYFEELVSIAARFPNIHLSLAGYMTFYHIAPRRVLEHIGRLLQVVGADRILWGSEAALAGGPEPYLKAFAALEMPAELRSDYGYPQITETDKRKILGENFAKMMGIDIEAKKRAFAAKAA